MSESNNENNEASTSGSESYYWSSDSENSEVGLVGGIGIGDNNFQLGAQPYMFEPERDSHDSSDEDNAANISSDSDSDDEHRDDRVGNTLWCNCGRCVAMTTVAESICCQETQRVKEVMDKQDENLECITLHPGFEGGCLNPWALDIAYLQYKQQYGGRAREATPDKKYRHTAYRQFVRWCWGFLGRNVRVPLPSCAVAGIRTRFPAGDGGYEGFKDM